ncbi:MAG: acyl-CoA dehydrogenase family protein [Dehalococcoidia bacterium]|nr:acyl-CoA dehydrogenase family protein [Dehalococcoidia bacterium]
MRFSFTEQQDALRCEIKDFFDREWNDEAKQQAEAAGDSATGHSSTLYKKLADRGWLALNWPKEYGGKGWTPMEMSIFNEECGYYRAPIEAFSLTSIVANAIIHAGNEEQKQQYLPKVATGDLLFCIGYSEPNAGSDLASLETKAVQDGDDYIINGVKTFNSAGHHANYCWLATRTDSLAPKHKGITVFLVDMKSPGVTVRPLYNIADGRAQNELVFEDVRVPKENMVGEKNRGWYVIAKALDIERISTSACGNQRRSLEELIEFCKETRSKGIPLSKDPLIRQKLVGLATEIDVARMLAYRVIWLQSQGEIPDVPASMFKLYSSSLSQKIAHVGVEILGLRGIVNGASGWSYMNGRPEYATRLTVPATVAGGTNEIQRTVIAQRGLGLPR